MSRPAAEKQRLCNALKAKGLTTAQLVEKLQALHEELQKMDQELSDLDSLASTKTELATKSLLTHKDRSVKAFTACCLADVLRLYAPEAPYTEAELKDIFAFFFAQLRNLSKTGDPHTTQYHYLLQNLSDVRSVCLICDLDGNEALLCRIFEDLFDSMTPQTPRSIELLAADVLAQLIDELDAVPSDVVERILAQFIPKNAKARPYTLRVATQICNETKDKLQRYVSQYFTEILGSAINELKADSDGDDEEEEDIDNLSQIRSAHSLIKEIHRNAPGLLLNVIPQLEAEMRVDNVELRTLAVRTVGQMLAEPNDIVKWYPTLWQSWLGRSSDKAVNVRVAVVEALRRIWTAHPVYATEIQATMATKLQDPDEKVRCAACAVFTGLDFEIALHHADGEILKMVGDRIKDKKTAVSSEALKAVARLFSLAYPSFEALEKTAVECFKWIPAAILDSMRIVDAELQGQIFGVLMQYILPLPASADEEEPWVDRFMLVYSLLEPPQQKQLLRLTNIDKQQNIYLVYVMACEAYNGGVIDADEEKVTKHFHRVVRSCAASFPEPSKATDSLTKFAKLNDSRFYKLLRTLMNPKTDLKHIIKAYNEYIRRIGENGSGIAETMTLFARRASLWLLCQSAIPPLLRRVQYPGDGTNADIAVLVAKELLVFIAKGKPLMYKEHIDILVEGIDGNETAAMIDTCCHAWSSLAKIEPGVVRDNTVLRDRTNHFLQHGSSAQAKAAATIIACDDTRSQETASLVATMTSELETISGDTLVAHLSALSRFARYAPECFEPFGGDVSSFILEKVLTKEEQDSTEIDEGPDWLDDANLGSHAQACLVSLKVLTNRLLAVKDKEVAVTISGPTFALLWQMLECGGDVRGIRRSPGVASRLRCQAAISLLRLATVRSFEAQVLRKFDALAWTMQDPVSQVRNAFLTKLTTYLFQQRLTHPAFNVILFLVAHDPDSDNIDMARASIVHRIRVLPQEMRVVYFETPLLRMLYLLAHHPDFSDSLEDILMTVKYIDFFLSCLAMSGNISFLLHLSSVLKSVQDAKASARSEHLYIISELAGHLIKSYANEHGWSLHTYQGKITVPQDLFKPLPSTDEIRQIMRTQYLSKESLEVIAREAKDAKVAARLNKAKAEQPKGSVAGKPTTKGTTNTKDTMPVKKRKSSPKTKEIRRVKKPTAQPKAKKRKQEWDSEASSAEDEAEDYGATSEEEAKPKGSRSRPQPASGGRADGFEGDEAFTKTKKRQSPNGTKAKMSPKRQKKGRADAVRSDDEEVRSDQ